MDPEQSPLSPGRRDVEKRWSEPRSFRLPVAYAVAVLVLALIVLAVFAATGGDHRALAVAVPGILLLGGLGALASGIAAYSRGRPWVPWQGAGWFLLVLMLAALPVPYAAWAGP